MKSMKTCNNIPQDSKSSKKKQKKPPQKLKLIIHFNNSDARISNYKTELKFTEHCLLRMAWNINFDSCTERRL